MTSLPWFRLYHRMIDDEKLRLLAFEDRWHFVALCCLKADGLLDEERSPLWERKVAVKLGVQLRELDEISRRLHEVGLIDGAMNPVAWDELQYKSDNSTSRVQAFREKQRKQSCNNVKRFGNVTVTGQETDTDTDTDKIEPKGSCASGDAPALDVNDFVESWNETAKACGLSQIQKLTDARRRAFNARRREYPEVKHWQSAFRCLAQSKWMHGDNRNGWRADPDFFLQAKSFTKLVEGQYAQADRP